jgi:cytochrome P450
VEAGVTSEAKRDLPGADFDHWTDEWATDPWPMTQYLRDADSLGWSGNHGGFWVVARYEDVCSVVRDPDNFSNLPGSAIPHLDLPPFVPAHSDPPQHHGYRKIINPYFTPNAVTSYLDWSREWVRDLADTLFASGRFDLARDFAVPLTRAMTFRFMGISEAKITPEVNQWSHDILYQTERMPDAAAKMGAFLMAEYADRRENPGDDVMTGIANGVFEGRPLNETELVMAGMLIMNGGLETTVFALGGGTRYLLQNPQAREQLMSADERTWRLAMDEIVRWTSPASANARTARSDQDVHQCPVKEGDRLLMMWGSANHDDSEFPEPEKMVLDRFPNRHLGFGMGPHRCVGSHLAKQTMLVFFQEVVPRLDGWRIADEDDAVILSGHETRGVTRLVIEKAE